MTTAALTYLAECVADRDAAVAAYVDGTGDAETYRTAARGMLYAEQVARDAGATEEQIARVMNHPARAYR